MYWRPVVAEDMTYIEVGECILITGGNEIPVVRFDVDFKLDTIPSADLVLAVGRDLEGAFEAPVGDLAEGDEAELTVEVDGQTITLIKGILSSISASDNAGLFRRSTSLLVHIEHGAIKLAGSPASNFVYTNDNQLIDVLQKRRLAIAQFGNTVGSKDDWNSVSGFSKEWAAQGDQQHAAKLLHFVTSNLAEASGTPGSKEFADNLLKPYEGANISQFVISVAPFIASVSTKYRQSWSTSNNWEALRRTANYLFLNLVPYNEGMYIADPLALAREPAIEIDPDEYLSWAPGMRMNLAEPVDGVSIAVPRTGGRAQLKISFPPIEGAVKNNRFYHFRNLPDWVYPIASMLYGRKPGGKVGIVARCAVEKQKAKMEGGNIDKHIETVGQALAKVIYSQLKLTTKVARAKFPFRTDLMPGTNIKFTSSDSAAVEFIGEVLYGMIISTRFSGDMTQEKGRLGVDVDIATLRNEQDNSNDEMTFAEHPVYAKLWKGTKLDGELL
jgi:hypothetical protein